MSAFFVRNRARGFTLIELLIVIAVLGVISTLVVLAINPAALFGRARDVQRKTDIRNIKDALQRYFIDNGSYPVTSTANVSTWVYSTTNSTSWIPGLSAYMKKVPKDPKNNVAGPWSTTADNYSYAYASNGSYYNLVARLERPEDKDRCQVKQYTYITNGATGGGSSWCGPYSRQIYSKNSKDL